MADRTEQGRDRSNVVRLRGVLSSGVEKIEISL